MTDPASRIEELLSREEAELASAFLAMLATVRVQINLSIVADFLERGDVEGALEQVLRNAPSRMSRATADAFIRAAQDTARFLGRSLGEIIIDFDQTNYRAVDRMRANALRLITGFTDQQRELTRAILVDGITEGINPREMARRLRDHIGLTERQYRAIQAYRRSLEELNANALARELRDRRFDRTVQAALRSGRALSPQQIDQMVGAYRDRMIRYRAQVISRTEALRAVHEGVEEMYEQAIEAGELDPGSLQRQWKTAKDERVRGSHRFMHNQIRNIGDSFRSGLGNALRFPGDSSAPAEDVIQCRCVVTTRFAPISNEQP